MARSKQVEKNTNDLKRSIERALFDRGWTQARLAAEIEKPLSTVNVAINHGLFPNVVKLILKTLDL